MRRVLSTLSRRDRRAWVLVGVLSAMVVGLAVAGYAACWSSIPFDRETWQRLSIGGSHGILGSKAPGGDARRARMLADLQARHLRPGMSHREVRALLGHSDLGDGTGPGLVEHYRLFHEPRWDQALVAWLRWRNPDPRLILEFQYSNPLRLARAVVR